jgi:hypothetical protein
MRIDGLLRSSTPHDQGHVEWNAFVDKAPTMTYIVVTVTAAVDHPCQKPCWRPAEGAARP